MSITAGRSLIRAVAQVQMGGAQLLSRISRNAVLTCASGFKRHWNTIQKVSDTRTLLSKADICSAGSSIKFLHQETPVSPEEGSTEQDTHIKHEIGGQLKIPEPVSLDSSNSDNHFHPSSSKVTERRNFRHPLEDDVSTEEDDVSTEDGWSHRGTNKELSQWEFRAALRKCTSPSDVLDLMTQCSMSLKQNSNCLTQMWDSVKKMPDEKRRYELKLMCEHPFFVKLCLHVMQECGRMSCPDLAYSTHALLKLKVSPHARVSETLLRHCQERLNEFDERALSVLANSLEGLEDSKNVDALRYGLRLLVEQRIQSIKGTLAIQTMMRCIGKDAPLSLKKELEAKALQLFDQFSLPNCQHMFVTLASINFCSLPLLNACSDRVTENIHGIPFWRLVGILQSCRDLQYRNVELFSAIGDYVAGTMYMWQIKQVVLFFSLFENLGFRHEGLMNIFAEQLIAKPENCTFKDLIIVLRVYSLLNHFPDVHNPRFLEAITSSLGTYIPRIPSIELLRVVYSFCIMGYFPQAPFDRLFKEDTLHELLNPAMQNVEVNERMLHYINLCLELDQSCVTKPSATIVRGTASSPPAHEHTSVLLALHSLLGEDVLFRQNVQLPNNYYFEFEVCLDKNRINVIPLTEDSELENAIDVQRVAVICAPISSFCLDTTHPRGKLAMKMRHLRAMGYHVVLVHERNFEQMNMEDRNAFLKSHIFSQETEGTSDLKSTDQNLKV